MILMTQEHNPAAAFDFETTTAGSKAGSDKNSFLTKATFAAGSSLALTIYLKPKSAVMKA